MDDKQKLFRLTKRLNADGVRGQASGISDRPQPTARARGSRHYTNMDTITAQMRAQMLDGNAALLDLANEPDESLLLQARLLPYWSCMGREIPCPHQAPNQIC